MTTATTATTTTTTTTKLQQRFNENGIPIVYVWRDTQIAETGGICGLCNSSQVIGEWMAFLGYDKNINKWDRGHLACARLGVRQGIVVDVQSRAQQAALGIATAAVSVVSHVQRTSIPIVEWRIVEPLPGDSRANKYALFIDDVELPGSRLSVKDEAIGAVKGIQAFMKMRGI